jgi:hypothetical protein
MGLFFVTYDAAHGNREALGQQLADWGAVAAFEGAWLLKTHRSAVEIRNALQALLRGEDPAVVLELQPGSWWASENLDPRSLAWLKANVLE